MATETQNFVAREGIPENRFQKVELRVTEECNRAAGPCGMKCFSDHSQSEGWPKVADPTLEEIWFMMGRIKEAGIPVANIVGGEATLRSDFVEILKMGKKEFGFQMVLTTNCDLLPREALDEISPYIDYLSISLDGSTAETNDRLRGVEHFQAATRVINAYDPNKHNFKLKVNTVLSRQNLQDHSVDNLAKLFGEKPIILKYIQFTPRGNGLGVRDDFSITREEFDNRVAEIQAAYPGAYVCKRTYEIDEVPDVLIVRPNGWMIINVGEKHQIIGDIYQNDVAEALKKTASQYPGLVKENVREYASSYPISA